MKDRHRDGIDQGNDRWADLRSAGLFRSGVHEDTTVTATTPTGDTVVMEVRPVRVNGGNDTLFAPTPGEATKMAQVFPRPARAI